MQTPSRFCPGCALFAVMALGLLVALLTGLLGGCPMAASEQNEMDDGSDSGMDVPPVVDQPDSQPDDQSDADETPVNDQPDLALSFAQDIQPIFDANCVVCHSPGGLADLVGIQLKLRAGESWKLLVNQASVQRSDLTLVTPGDAQASLLFQKISSASPPVGSRMPLGLTPLLADEIELIRTWIEEGAPDN